MKKIFRIFALAALLILAALIILPFAFKGKIIQIVKQEINKSVNARVDFSSASLSLFRSFPDFSLRLNRLSVVGNEPFEQDTLAFIPTMSLTLDLRSVFRGSPYEIKKIVLNQPALKLLVLKDGSYNWDILLPEEQLPSAQGEAPAEAEQIVLNMNKLLVNNGYFIYDDREMDFVLRLINLTGEANGKLSESISVFDSQASAGNLEMVYEGITYLSGIKPTYSGEFEVDLDKDYYTMRNNRLYLNDLAIDVEGGFGFVGEDIVLAINFESKDKNFKKLLSLVPAIYSRDFDKVQAEGEFTLSGFVDGLYGDVSMPGFGLDMDVHQARFKYPDLPESMENITVNISVKNKTGDMDATTVDISKFDFVLAGSPFHSKFFLKNPISDPDIVASLKGKLDLGSLSKVVPLRPEEALNGILHFDTRFSGKKSSIESKRYNDILAEGSLIINDMRYHPQHFQLPVQLHEAQFNFTSSYLELVKFNSTIGQSHIETSGKAENYLAFYLGDEYLKAHLILHSDLLDINELLVAMSDKTGGKTNADTIGHSLPELPERMDIDFSATAGKILFQDYALSNVKANITYKDQVINFSPLSAEMLGGKVDVKGIFDASEKNLSFIDLDFGITRFGISQAYQAIGLLQQVAPIAEKTKGTFSAGLKLKGKLDSAFNPVYESLQGGGKLQTSQISIESVKVLDQLANLLGNDDYKRLVTDGIDIAFQFLNGKVYQEPFTLSWGGAKTTISGFVGFDRQMDLALNFQIPFSKFGPGANQAVQKLATEAAKKGIALHSENGLVVKARLTGSFTDPNIILDYQSAAANLKNEIQHVIRQEIEKQKEEALQKLSEAAQKILDDAHRKGEELMAKANEAAETIRSEAATTSEKFIIEANARATRIEEEGKKKGPIAEIAARETARTIRSEAQNTAQRMVKEADKKASDLVNEARSQSDEIMRQAQSQVDRL
ncbi:MAG: AsmA-like C-terminal region-containing protein [Bacteroidales bacterium]|nr:AsmA-like C-terminal region-containing protein [Bacteroidales bacterium]